MTSLQNILVDFILFAEFLSAFVALLYFRKVKDTYWKWFAYYLIFIFCAEMISAIYLENFAGIKKYYYNYFVIPVEFIFLYWLYAVKSLAKKRQFFVCSSIYLICLLAYILFFDKPSSVSSINYIIGTLVLMIMITQEIIKQIKSDKILFFKENMMFYINFGIILFYIATLPFYAFNEVLYKESRSIWEAYSNVTLISCSLMYFLFAASFIWGKPST